MAAPGAGLHSSVLMLALLLLPPDVGASPDPAPQVTIARFSTLSPGEMLPEAWRPLTFKKIPRHSVYSLVADGGVTTVKASSQAAASGLVRKVDINLKDYPIIHWRWKVDHLLQKSDATKKEGDDYPARIYITFAYEADRVGMLKRLQYKLGRSLFGDIPIAAINYIWEPRLAVNTIIANPYTASTQMIVVKSGGQHVGTWVSEQRNVYQDYLQAFGEEPPQVNAVAIMTDTDNTGEQAVAYYGDIYFTREAVISPIQP